MLLESKSLLAKLMATENLVVEQRKVSTAFFDTVSRVLVVPILDNNIPTHTYDLFMGHEVGHALWTPSDGHEIRQSHSIPHGLANVVEDSRIERKIKYKYPGLKNSFIKGYKDLFERDFFETEGKNINTMKFIDRLNLHCKVGALLNIFFTEEEKNLVKEVESTETYEDVMNVCQKIIDFTKNAVNNSVSISFNLPEAEEFAEEEDDVSDLTGFNEEMDDEEVPGDGNTDETEEENDDFKGTGEVSSEKNESESESEETSELDNKGSEKSVNNDLEEKVSELLESTTDSAYRQNEHKLFSSDSVNYTYANVPRLDINDITIDFKDVYSDYDRYANRSAYSVESFYDIEGFRKLRDEIKTGVSYLVKEFEMRKAASQSKKASTAKTGDLNMSKIYSHQYNEDIFKKIAIVPGAKSHGLVIFLDWSGSMTYHLQNTVKQLFNIVMFCKKVNIPYEVYTFTNPGAEEFRFTQHRKSGDLLVDNFKLLNVLSSRMNAQQFTKAAAAMVCLSRGADNYHAHTPPMFAMNGTPLNNTIMGAMEIVPAFQKKNNLQVVNTIFLTDGEGDSALDVCGTGGHTTRLMHWNYGTSSPNVVIIRDPVTKHQEKVDFDNSRKVTSAFIKLFKLRTKCNIVGFYILSPNEFKTYLIRNLRKDTQDIRANFSKNHCAVIENEGFDEYYLLRSKRGESEGTELVVKENASSKALASAFAKYNTKKNFNRVVLNRFINMIA